MERKDLPISDTGLLASGMDEDSGADLSAYMIKVNEAAVKVSKLEQQLTEVEQFYSAANKNKVNFPRDILNARDKEKERYFASLKKRKNDPLQREAAAAQRMQRLMHEFGILLGQLTQHSWAEPFMQPVDVEGLGLTDYYQVIEKPMDFATIKTKMEATDGTGYRNVREICADVRLIFKNAMKYNHERDDVHIMAKTMLAKFEEKWLQLLPKVDQEESIRKEEEAEAQFEMQLIQEANYAKMAKDLRNQIDEFETSLEELKKAVLQNCRKMTHEEKKAILLSLTKLNPDELHQALMIISQDQPAFDATVEEVNIDLDALCESTLWRLKYFVRQVMRSQDKAVAVAGYNHNNNHQTRNFNNRVSSHQIPQKRVKKEP